MSAPSDKVRVVCPHCWHVGSAKAEVVGRTVTCPGCGWKFEAEAHPDPQPLTEQEQKADTSETAATQGGAIAAPAAGEQPTPPATKPQPKPSEVVAGFVVLVVLGVVAWYFFFRGSGGEKTIPYEVVVKEENLAGKLLLEVLVSETATKQEVMKLAESLRRKYDGEFVYICIFDSREAQKRRTDFTYPEKKLSRHWLVVIDGWPLDQEIRWVAERRDH